MEGVPKAFAKGVAAGNGTTGDPKPKGGGTTGDPLIGTEEKVPPNSPNGVAEAPAATLEALRATVGWIFKNFVTRAMQ